MELKDMPEGAKSSNPELEYWNRSMSLTQLESELEKLEEADDKKYLRATKFEDWKTFEKTFPSYSDADTLGSLWKVRPSSKFDLTFM